MNRPAIAFSLLKQGGQARRLLRAAGMIGPDGRVPSTNWLRSLSDLYNGRATHAGPLADLPAPWSVHACLPSKAKLRWQLAIQCVGLQLDVFSLRPTFMACQDPLLSAHLAALAAGYQRGDDYTQGLAAWLRPRLQQLRLEGISARKLASLRASCLGEPGVQGLEHRLRLHVEKRYGLGEGQLCCPVFQPFAGEGARLGKFLKRCHPDHGYREVQFRRVLSGQVAPVEVARWLQRNTGLSMPLLRRLYDQTAGPGDRSAPRWAMLGDCALGHGASRPAPMLLGKAKRVSKPAITPQSTEGAGQE